MHSLPDAGPGRKSPDPSTHAFAPYFGWVPRGDWQPSEPGPQPHNRGVTPPRPNRRRPVLADRVQDLEHLLSDALARLAAVEAARGGADA